MITWWAALIGLALSIILILRKVDTVYSLMIGAIIGALLGGFNLAKTSDMVVTGVSSVSGTIVRVIAAGVLAGVMMDSGAADTIARAIVEKLGSKLAIFSLTLSTMIITSVGVFIPVAVLIVAPIALEVGRKLKISKLALLVALSGGGKAGNIISPNPNTIAAAKGFNIELSQLMIADFIPAIVGLIVAVFLGYVLKNRGPKIEESDLVNIENKKNKDINLPSLRQAISTPVIAIVLLLINPLGNIFNIDLLKQFNVDAMFILPFAGIIGTFIMKKRIYLLDYLTSGIRRMTDVILILIGAGMIAGMISNSALPLEVVKIVKVSGISGTFLAPISGILMAAATASTSTGVILASGSFNKAILSLGISDVGAAAMVHTGATVIDHLPHGNYFHVTGNAMKLSFKQRFQAVVWETIVGLSMTIIAVILYGKF